MHEIGALYKMVQQAEDTARENGYRRVKTINLEVGELSGILPVFLDKFYPVVVENREMTKDCELKYTIIPGKGLCSDCMTMYDIMKQRGVCPKCGSRNKKILGGRDFVLKSIELYEEDGPDETE